MFGFFFTVLDDEDDAGLITTGSIVTVSVTVLRRNLGVSSFWFKNFEVIWSHGTLYYSLLWFIFCWEDIFYQMVLFPASCAGVLWVHHAVFLLHKGRKTFFSTRGGRLRDKPTESLQRRLPRALIKF